MLGFGGGRTQQSRENVPAYIFVVSTVALAVVLYLAWASFFKLGAVCMLCVATYVAVIAIFIISGGATKFPMRTLPQRASKDVVALLKSPVALILAFVFSMVGAVTLINAFPSEHAASSTTSQARQYPPFTDQQRYNFNQWLDLQKKEDIPISADGAKVVIAKFNDYQCPACRAAYFDLKELVEKYKGSKDVKFVTLHYPLEPECNAGVPSGNHMLACEAAAAVVMAESKGTADKLEEWIFTNQQDLTAASLRKAAADVGGITDFEAQYANALTKVRSDADIGNRVKVKSTPTFFLSGRRVDQALPPQAIELAIEHDLKQ
jgi:protein-disulfide isomerase